MKLYKSLRVGLVALVLAWFVGKFFQRKEEATGAEYFLARKADGTPEIIAVQPLPDTVTDPSHLLHFMGDDISNYKV